MNKEKKYTVTLLLATILGLFGVHRFVNKKTTTGIVMLFTCGGFGIWYIVDIILILTGKFSDENNEKITSDIEFSKNYVNYIAIGILCLTFIFGIFSDKQTENVTQNENPKVEKEEEQKTEEKEPKVEEKFATFEEFTKIKPLINSKVYDYDNDSPFVPVIEDLKFNRKEDNKYIFSGNVIREGETNTEEILNIYEFSTNADAIDFIENEALCDFSTDSNYVATECNQISNFVVVYNSTDAVGNLLNKKGGIKSQTRLYLFDYLEGIGVEPTGDIVKSY